jgi:SAM-dependent methyltransferase
MSRSQPVCRPIERQSVMASLAHSLRPLRHIGWLRSSVYLAIIVKRRIVPDPWLSPPAFQHQYADRSDPWGYETEAGGERLRRAAALLDNVAKGRRWGRALEIGCSEGAFTRMLAERCEDLVAVDFAPIALHRASQRRDWGGRVKFLQLDLMRDHLNGGFDLITLMDVLDYFPTREMKAACEKVIGALPGGGQLLMTGVKQADVFDTAWWSRWIIWGGQRIKRHLSEHLALKLVAEADMDTHVLAVFEKI